MIQYGNILHGNSTAAIGDCSIRVVDIILTALLEYLILFWLSAAIYLISNILNHNLSEKLIKQSKYFNYSNRTVTETLFQMPLYCIILQVRLSSEDFTGKKFACGF